MIVRARGSALVVSLDFELHWGVRDHRALDRSEMKRLLTAREVVPRLLSVFREHGIRATWATVGLLFARSREEAEACRPARLPAYNQPSLNPYQEKVGRDESEDPFHFAPSLIREIAQEPGQEIASHSYSHYYPLEAGQGETEFLADLESARVIANHSEYRMKSYVFPRNQVRSTYLPLLAGAGFMSYRGTEAAVSKAPIGFGGQRRPWKRAMRLLDTYLNVDGMQTIEWPEGAKPVSIGASRYLRPYSDEFRLLEGARLRRISEAMKHAGREGKIFHLWWHPEDFAGNPERNFDFLDRVLQLFGSYRREYGMASLSMGEVTR